MSRFRFRTKTVIDHVVEANSEKEAIKKYYTGQELYNEVVLEELETIELYD